MEEEISNIRVKGQLNLTVIKLRGLLVIKNLLFAILYSFYMTTNTYLLYIPIYLKIFFQVFQGPFLFYFLFCKKVQLAYVTLVSSVQHKNFICVIVK